MLHPEKYSPQKIRKIQRACCRVFMSGKPMHSELASEYNRTMLHYPFLEQLTFEDVKQAYRTNVFTYHPDRHQEKEPQDIEFYSRHVEEVNRAYEYLSSVFNGRRTASESDVRSRIIAVGGAKGGIGKSIFAANLGTMLSSLGFRVALVDLDLGGSDLHIFLGHKRIPEVTLNDFLNRKVTSLEDAAVGCGQGPALIAGDCGELGAANIPFQKKMRLMESIRKINADYVVLDLGGGTDFNTLDFFLASDMGIVLSTLDQSSYLEAYAFIKTALQRKLNRLFGAGSSFPGRKNEALREIVVEGARAPDKDNPRTTRSLLEKVTDMDPVSLPLITDEILDFSPSLVINHSFDNRAALRIASTLRAVACQRLSIDINHVGTISKHRIIEQSTTYTHHPLVGRQRCLPFTSEIEAIVRALGLAP
jgi:flagellar biosynthesis protein FlhG